MKHATVVATLVLLALLAPATAGAQGLALLIGTLDGATVVAQDGHQTVLGRIVHEMAGGSIFSQSGDFGSKYGAASVWNEGGAFGSGFGPYSARNPIARTPPQILKDDRVVGYLTTNPSIAGGVHPDQLRKLKDRLKAPAKGDGC